MKWAVLVGGTGSNLRAFLERGLEVCVVVSHRRDAGALDVAAEYNIPAVVLLPKHFRDRDDYGRALGRELAMAGAEGVALAGFMRWLDTATVQTWSGRIFNIHPSLLPAFAGLNAVGQALAHGVQWTGVTVHLVDEGQDSGPIVAQVPVEVTEGDTEASLSERIHCVEHSLYWQVLHAFEERKFYVEGARVHWREGQRGAICETVGDLKRQ